MFREDCDYTFSNGTNMEKDWNNAYPSVTMANSCAYILPTFDDLIREGVVFNFGLAYGFAMNQMNTFWKGQISQNGNLSSSWASQEKGYKAAIDKFYENVEALDQ